MTRTTDPLDQLVIVNFKMTERDRRAFKIWCVENDMTMTDALLTGISLLREMRERIGKEPEDVLLEVIDAVDGFLIDKEREIRVERRGSEAWAVCEGASVVNRVGGREHEPMPSSRDEAFITRTRFPLAEALRIARARVGGDG